MNGNLATHGGRVKFDTTTVFASAAAPLAMTDLDLSAVVGARAAVVILIVTKTAHTANTNYQFRRNGDTRNYYPNGGGGVCVLSANARSARVLVNTDTNGIVEWFATNNDTVTVQIEAFWYE